jgi:hypothetical protein
MSSAKHWCFTLNNYTEDDEQRLRSIGESKEDITYIVFGREVGQEGTKHLQGFVSYTKRRTLAWSRRFISTRAHFEKARGSPKQASDYCKKDQDFEEFGEVPQGQGARTDLAKVVQSIKEGATLAQLAEEHPAAVLRYGSGVQRLRLHYRPVRESPPEIWTLWGKTGTGKTRRVWEYANKEELWVHPGDRWFDGYDGHKAVLFDDFDGSWFKLSYLLRILDRYPMQVPVKGGYAWWVPRVIYITSNLEPKDWYPQANDEHRRALNRRLTEFGHIVHCTENY